jgi:7-cyano-7-deazaguanine synthase
VDNSNYDKVAVLFSGGLDSCVLAADLAANSKRVCPIYVRQGFVWESIEEHWAKQFLEALASRNIDPLRKIELPVQDVYSSHWSTTGERMPDHRSDDHEVYLPGRNLLLLSKAALFCALNQVPEIASGQLSGNPFPDSTPEFFAKFQEVASLGMSFSLSIQTPFLKLSKVDIILRGKHLPLQLSFSCLNPIGFDHCGACNKCAERRKAFYNAGIADKTKYDELPVLR